MSVSEDPFALISECFWDLDYYKNTVKRTEDGLFMCNEVSKCVQERAEIEKEYAKRLKGWARKWNDSFERGMLHFGSVFFILDTVVSLVACLFCNPMIASLSLLSRL